MSRLFIFLRLILDIFLIPVIIMSAYALKFKLGWFITHFFQVSWITIYRSSQIEPYLTISWLVLLVWISTFAFSGMYRRFWGLMPEVDESLAVVKGVSLATLEIMAITFLYRSFPGSRFVIFYAWALGIISLILIRALIWRVEAQLLARGHSLVRTLVVGVDSLGQDLIERMFLSPSLGYYYVGSLAEAMPMYCHFHLRDKLHLLGNPADFAQLMEEHRISALLITESLPKPLLKKMLKHCEARRIRVMLISDSDHFPGFSRPGELDGISFLASYFPPRSGLGLLGKRLFDIAFSLIALVVLFPAFVAVGLLIKCCSPRGPIFYHQERVGYDQKPFMMMKFRTMVPNAESHTGPVMVSMTQETRYILGGDFLRKMSIDELPQLWNILKGDMSLVGPRPERPYFVEKFTQENPQFPLRHTVKGGLTGWAQVNGRSVLTQNPQHKLRYDLYYINHWSFILDIKIIIKTFFVVFRREEAY